MHILSIALLCAGVAPGWAQQQLPHGLGRCPTLKTVVHGCCISLLDSLVCLCTACMTHGDEGWLLGAMLAARHAAARMVSVVAVAVLRHVASLLSCTPAQAKRCQTWCQPPWYVWGNVGRRARCMHRSGPSQQGVIYMWRARGHQHHVQRLAARWGLGFRVFPNPKTLSAGPCVTCPACARWLHILRIVWLTLLCARACVDAAVTCSTKVVGPCLSVLSSLSNQLCCESTAIGCVVRARP